MTLKNKNPWKYLSVGLLGVMAIGLFAPVQAAPGGGQNGWQAVAAGLQSQIDAIIGEDFQGQIDALVAAKNIEIDQAEAILRVEVGSKVNDMTSKEIKRDLLVFAKRNPALFLDLIQDDNIELRNFGIKAVEAGVLKLSPDQRNFTWASNGRKILTVPFDEHPYSALASFFKTDEGIEIYKNIEKR